MNEGHHPPYLDSWSSSSLNFPLLQLLGLTDVLTHLTKGLALLVFVEVCDASDIDQVGIIFRTVALGNINVAGILGLPSALEGFNRLRLSLRLRSDSFTALCPLPLHIAIEFFNQIFNDQIYFFIAVPLTDVGKHRHRGVADG